MFVLSIVLLPFRAVAVIVAFLSALCLANFIAADPQLSSTKPHSSRRKKLLMPLMVLVARLVYFFGGIQWVTVKGRRASATEAPILVLGPHSSFLDTLAVVILGMPSCVALAHYARSVVGGFVRVLQPILVSRDCPNSRQQTVDQVRDRAASGDWPQLVIFPEGTCTNRTCLVSFRRGAFEPGVPVQPVLLRWPNRVDNITWAWKGIPVWKLLWFTISQFNVRFEIEYLPVYKPSAEEKSDAQLYANNVRRVMAKQLQIPTTNLRYSDYCRRRVARDCHIPDPEGSVYLHGLLLSAFSHNRFNQSHTKQGLTHWDWVQRRLNQLLTIARYTPLVSQLCFIDALCPQTQPDYRETFLLNMAIKHYAATGSTLIDMRRFMSHACMFLYASDAETALRLAMKAYPLVSNKMTGLELKKPDIFANVSPPHAISLNSVRELLRNIFNPIEEHCLDDLIEECSSQSNKFEDVPFDGDSTEIGIESDKLYNLLCEKQSDEMTNYANFEVKLHQLLGPSGRPLLPPRSHASEPMPSFLPSTDSISGDTNGVDLLLSTSHRSVPTVPMDEDTLVRWRLLQDDQAARIPSHIGQSGISGTVCS